MIEVEKKFKLSEDDTLNLLKGAEFLGEKKFIDIYYDRDDYNLSKNDIWLRNRNGKWDLKIPKHVIGKDLTQQYQEIEGEDKIREVFGLPVKNDFVLDIKEFGYEVFCRCETFRKKYQKEGFNIDIDLVDYGDFEYSLAEIELMVESEELMNMAAKKIEEFATNSGLKNAYVRGKVREYLFRKRPKHFKAMIDAGVIDEK